MNENHPYRQPAAGFANRSEFQEGVPGIYTESDVRFFPNHPLFTSSVRRQPTETVPPEDIGLADILRVYGEEYIRKHSVTPEQRSVINAVLNCRTGNFGYHIDVCDACGHAETAMNSCRNRHCPQCQGNKRTEWAAARAADILPVPYYHIVVTIPNDIFPVSLYNQKVIYSLLFSCAAETLRVFGRDPKRLGASAGFFMVLHTWGQLMNAHIHLHIIFPACGVNENDSVVFPKHEKNRFLFPVHALSKVFRGKYIAGLKEAYRNGEMSFPGDLAYLTDPEQFHKWLNRLTSHRWVIYAKPPFGDPEIVIGYVSRYTHRVAISNTRILSTDNGIILFSFKNYKNSSAWEEAELPADGLSGGFCTMLSRPGFTGSGITDFCPTVRRLCGMRSERS